MNSQAIQDTVWKLVKTGAAVTAVRMAGLPEMAENLVGNNNYLVHVPSGALYASSKELVDYFTEGKSKLMDGQYIEFLDDVSFYSALSFGADVSGAGPYVTQQAARSLPLSDDMVITLVEAGMVTGGKLVGDYLDVKTGDNVAVDLVRKPVSTIYNKVNGDKPVVKSNNQVF